jgi:hypothetical protein
VGIREKQTFEEIAYLSLSRFLPRKWAKMLWKSSLDVPGSIFCLQFSYSFLCLLSPMVVPLSSVFSHKTSFGWTERFIYIQNFWRLRTEFGLFDRMSQYAVNQWCNSGKKNISIIYIDTVYKKYYRNISSFARNKKKACAIMLTWSQEGTRWTDDNDFVHLRIV